MMVETTLYGVKIGNEMQYVWLIAHCINEKKGNLYVSRISQHFLL